MAIELILLGAVVIFVIGFLLGRLITSRNKSEKKPQNIPTTVQKSASLPKDVEMRVQALIDNGHKIGALKELRDSTDLELEQAKSIVESMAISVPTTDNPDKLGTVRDLIRSGNKIEALRLYRESSGMNLAEATEAIDKMEKEFG